MEQIYLHSDANCAYERKNVYFQYVLIGDFDILQTCFVYDFVLNDIKVNFNFFFIKMRRQTVYHG